jgi:hypothetical protein
MWGWITAAAGIVQAALCVFYRPVAPAYVFALSAVGLAGACIGSFARWPSRSAAARFADEHLGGRCAYRTVLEIGQAGKCHDNAVETLIEWLKRHEPTARRNLQALPKVPWPRAALASAGVSMALSLTLLHIPGIAARSAHPVDEALTESLAASPGGIRQPAASASLPPSPIRRPPPTVASRPGTGGTPDPSSEQEPGGSMALPARHISMSGNDAGDHPGTPGILAGAAHDAVLAARLAQTIEFAGIERHTLERSDEGVSGRHAGAAFESDSASSSAARLAGSPGPADAARAAVRPREALEWAPPQPAARTLMSRYLAERGQ